MSFQIKDLISQKEYGALSYKFGKNKPKKATKKVAKTKVEKPKK